MTAELLDHGFHHISFGLSVRFRVSSSSDHLALGIRGGMFIRTPCSSDDHIVRRGDVRHFYLRRSFAPDWTIQNIWSDSPANDTWTNDYWTSLPSWDTHWNHRMEDGKISPIMGAIFHGNLACCLEASFVVHTCLRGEHSNEMYWIHVTLRLHKALVFGFGIGLNVCTSINSLDRSWQDPRLQTSCFWKTLQKKVVMASASLQLQVYMLHLWCVSSLLLCSLFDPMFSGICHHWRTHRPILEWLDYGYLHQEEQWCFWGRKSPLVCDSTACSFSDCLKLD